MSYPRPDELASQAQIEKSKRFDRNIESGINLVKGVATSAAGIGIASKIAPFLNSLIPSDLALKGISKVSPKLGGFLKKGLESGLDLKEGLEYLRKGLEPKKEEQTSKNTKEDRNIIQQYSPDMHSFIEQQMARGMSPVQAGAIIANDKKYEKIIKQMMKDHKVPFSQIVEMTYGKDVSGNPATNEPIQNTAPQENQQPQPQKTDWSELLAAIRNG